MSSVATGTSSSAAAAADVAESPGGWLRAITPLLASIALTIVVVAVLTGRWLLTEERMPNPYYNGTGDRDYLTKHTESGLWRLCYSDRKYIQVLKIILIYNSLNKD